MGSGGGSACIPDEIVMDILVRFPPKFLGCYKCVSKHWNTLISDPKFIKTNFSLNTSRRNKVLYLADAVVPKKKSLVILDADADADDKPIVSFPKQSWHRLVGSCNGLVLAIDWESNLLLLNPMTQVYKIFPILGTLKGANIGLGYDSVADDYTVVTITPQQTVFFYAFKSGSRKRVQNYPLDPLKDINNECSSVFLNASIHWLLPDFMVITAFDLTAEKFRELPLPQPPRFYGRGRSFTFYLDVVGGCLCLFDREYYWDGRFDIWVMKEYGMEESWTWFSVDLLNTLPLVQPQEGFVLDHLEELILIDKFRRKVWSYDANEGTWRCIYVPAWHIHMFTFSDSLISP